MGHKLPTFRALLCVYVAAPDIGSAKDALLDILDNEKRILAYGIDSCEADTIETLMYGKVQSAVDVDDITPLQNLP